MKTLGRAASSGFLISIFSSSMSIFCLAAEIATFSSSAAIEADAFDELELSLDLPLCEGEEQLSVEDSPATSGSSASLLSISLTRASAFEAV